MTQDELIELAKTTPVSEDEIEAFRRRHQERVKEFEEWEQAQRQFDYDRRYNI